MNEWTEASDANPGIVQWTPTSASVRTRGEPQRSASPVRRTRRCGRCPSGSRSPWTHENPEIDRVVSENEHFATVDKFFGARNEDRPGIRSASMDEQVSTHSLGRVHTFPLRVYIMFKSPGTHGER